MNYRYWELSYRNDESNMPLRIQRHYCKEIVSPLAWVSSTSFLAHKVGHLSKSYSFTHLRYTFPNWQIRIMEWRVLLFRGTCHAPSFFTKRNYYYYFFCCKNAIIIQKILHTIISNQTNFSKKTFFQQYKLSYLKNKEKK